VRSLESDGKSLLVKRRRKSMENNKTTIELRQDKNKEAIVEKLKQSPIIQIACKKVGIGRATYYRWRKQDKKFRKAADKAIYEGILLINDMAESQLISAIKDKHMTGIIFWLKNRHSAYADRIKVDANINNRREKLSPEQEALVRKALNLVNAYEKERKTNEKINRDNNK
jgi:hypothetical protein